MTATAWTTPPAVEEDEAEDDPEDELFGNHSGERSKELLSKLEQLQFDYMRPPERPRPTLILGEAVICTPGNLSNIQAPAKAGKSAVVGAILASMMVETDNQQDTLGFVSENPKGYAVLHFDTEQSTYDHDALVRRAMDRAESQDPPPGWFYSYCLTGLSVEDRLGCIFAAIHKADLKHRGVFMVIIDGVADLCWDPNDSRESFKLVHLLHKAAIQYECSIITVLHENPGSDNGKMRGHLGSQLERKAETPLRLHKDAASGITTIWADRARHCHVPKSHGTCFVWSDRAQMHVSCGSASEVKTEGKSAKLAGEAAAAFGDAEALSHTDLKTRIMETAKVKEDAAKKRIKTYTESGVVVHEDRLYRLAGIPAAQVDAGVSAVGSSPSMASDPPVSPPAYTGNAAADSPMPPATTAPILVDPAALLLTRHPAPTHQTQIPIPIP